MSEFCLSDKLWIYSNGSSIINTCDVREFIRLLKDKSKFGCGRIIKEFKHKRKIKGNKTNTIDISTRIICGKGMYGKLQLCDKCEKFSSFNDIIDKLAGEKLIVPQAYKVKCAPPEGVDSPQRPESVTRLREAKGSRQSPADTSNDVCNDCILFENVDEPMEDIEKSKDAHPPDDIMKSNLDKLPKELDKRIKELLEEHCDNCEEHGVCDICFPNFIDLALKMQREAILKDVDKIDFGDYHNFKETPITAWEFARKKFKQLLKGKG